MCRKKCFKWGAFTVAGCIFCEFVNGSKRCKKLYENEKVFAFEDINPKAPVHFLVIPKKHIENVLKLDSDDYFVVSYIIEAIKNLAVTMGLEKGFRLINNCGVGGGQTVNHLHFHVLGNIPKHGIENLTWPDC